MRPFVSEERLGGESEALLEILVIYGITLHLLSSPAAPLIKAK